MEMMKKLAILVVAIILGGLGYAAYQRYSVQQSDSVVIQGGKVGNGRSCQHDSHCQSNHCYAGLCSKYSTKENNEIVEGVALGVAAIPLVATGAALGVAAGATALGAGTGAAVGGLLGYGSAVAGVGVSATAIATQK